VRWLVCLLLLAGCRSREMAARDLAPPPDLAPPVYDLTPPPPDLTPPPRDPKEHPPLPRVDDRGGGVISAPELWTVVWKGEEALGMSVERFHAEMLASTYWSDIGLEYGVHGGVSKGLIVLDEPVPMELGDFDLEDRVVALAAQQMYQPTPQTIYVLVVPRETHVGSFGFDGCVDYGGYHSETGAHQPFEVALQCSGVFDELTYVLSHEAIEAATDPRPHSAPGWRSKQLHNEVADLCNPLATSFDVGLTSYYVTRSWSDEAAQRGDRDPCVPAPVGKPWFAAAIEPSFIPVVLDQNGRGEAYAEIRPFSYGSVGVIKWSVMGLPPGIRMTPLSGSGGAGSTTKVKITVDDTVFGGDSVFWIDATSKVGENLWWGVIEVQ
jgi:hypothetical protein